MRVPLLRLALVALAASAAVPVSAAHAQPAAKPAKPPSFADAVKQQAKPLTLAAGALAGAGAAPLKAALADANFVVLGEDHGIAQIPQLATAICTELAPRGVHRLALEVGAAVGPELTRMASAPDGAAQLAAFTAKYPETIAFYDWQEEFAFVSACARATAARKAPLEIWGLDQELMGASQFVLDQILATRPGTKATTAITALAKAAADARATAIAKNDFGALFLFSAKQAPLTAATAALKKDGSAVAQALFASLLRSRVIYQGQSGPDPYLSNRDRAKLMKETFLDDLSAAARADGAFPKVFLKFGAYHGYRGNNPLHSSEIGNLIGEAAEGHRVTSLHVIALGVKGQQLAMVGPGKAAPVPLDLTADPDMAFLAPFFAAQAPRAWTIFDLRTFRSHWGRFGALDPELERLVFGYDFLVLIPDPQPQHPRT
ncbi:MAG: hypothetical protein K8W52_26855 [Deltaproteobacteria bacterium]|nr:hypothetical protein [Deltaproteobacteria bacterium]